MPIPTTPAPADPTPARADLYELLRERIVRGELAPGEVIDVRVLAHELGVTAAPLRELLAQLASVGLVEVVPRQFTRVAPLYPALLRDGAELGRALVRQAIRHGGPDPAAKADLAAYRDGYLVDASTLRARTLEDGMRDPLVEIVVRSTGSGELARVTGRLEDLRRRAAAVSGLPDDLDRALAVRRATVDALLAGDLEAAAGAWDPELGPTGGMSPDVVGAGVGLAPPPTIRDRAADTIRAAILDGTLLPGELLPEPELMSWLRTSRSPVREALARLESQGLVELRAYRTSLVARPSPRTVREVLEVVGVLRGIAVRRAMALADEEFLADVRGLVDRYRRVGSDGRPDLALTFAERLVTGSGSALFVELDRREAARLRWWVARSPDRGRARLDELLTGVADAVAAGDADEAEHGVRRLHQWDVDAQGFVRLADPTAG